MKKVHLVIVFAFLSLGVFSQKKIALGVRSGLNYSKITHGDFDYKPNFYIAALLNIKLSELYTLQPELGYSALGGKANSSTEKDITINYITLSVINKFYVKKTGFHFLIGPSLYFDFDDTFIGLANREEGNDITFIDFVFTTGVGYEFKNGLGVELRYNQGLTDVYSGNWHDFRNEQLENEIQYNSAFQLGLTYKFNLAKKEK